ncbi:putative peptidylprolyl isomerase [Rosa chinensis]|uniref:peptidylprolyl isomerase n=1 Tax=Rosa chinensis TaxID=74649 RepID=A0A2P6SG31_ROSCH|nr:peptidyl-prolyl cis-trans isomerase FKBP43 [Rosa chinensis]PRQ57641.1 putative peptidylprolyl isomerase [Rosa chinensis]
MAFWGIEVKPGKPFTHKPDDSNGRLHISMATLGLGAATKRSILQCNVGNKSPVYLCALYPEKIECLQLHLEFDEADEVMFSVLGPRSVHLAGYYLGGRRPYNPDESESFGEDIADSETQRSVNSEDEKYDDSFIDDDDDLEVFPSTPASDATDSDSCSEEEFLAKKKPQKGKVRHRQLRKTYVISDSEVESENGDDDSHPISSLVMTKSSTVENAIQEVEEKVDTSNKKAVDDFATESIRHADDVLVDGQLKRQLDQPVDLSSKVDLENGGKPKRKRKERLQEEKTVEADVLNKEDEAQKNEAEAENRNQNGQLMPVNHSGAEMPDNLSLLSAEVGLGNSDKPKKKKKKRVEEKTAEVICTNPGNDIKEDEAKGDFCLDPPLKSEQNQKSAKDESFGHDSHKLVDEPDEKKVKKKKKKKSKTQSHGETLNTDIALLSVEEKVTSPMENEANYVDAKSSEVRTVPSGLHIEELEAGEPNGKVATSGKKITVHYVGKLKENGEVVDSCDGGPPSKFRLGRGKVMEGLDAGIDGMRVGGKRRLVIPPSMAYGSKGDDKDIPPDSWLVYDVELVKVH